MVTSSYVNTPPTPKLPLKTAEVAVRTPVTTTPELFASAFVELPNFNVAASIPVFVFVFFFGFQKFRSC